MIRTSWIKAGHVLQTFVIIRNKKMKSDQKLMNLSFSTYTIDNYKNDFPLGKGIYCAAENRPVLDEIISQCGRADRSEGISR